MKNSRLVWSIFVVPCLLSMHASANYIFCIDKEYAKNNILNNWHWADGSKTESILRYYNYNETSSFYQYLSSNSGRWIYFDEYKLRPSDSIYDFMAAINVLDYNFGSLKEANDFCNILENVCKKNESDSSEYFVGKTSSSYDIKKKIKLRYKTSDFKYYKNHTCPSLS